MNDEQSYHHFLQTVFTDEVYIINEPEASYTPNKKPETVKQNLSETSEPSPLYLPEKDTHKVVFVLNEALTGDLSVRFNTLLEKLNFNEQNTNIINLSEHDIGDAFESALFQLKPDKMVFLGAKKAIHSEDLEENFLVSKLRGKGILTMPAFSSIVQDKEQVMKCWQALKEFLN